MPKDLNVWSHLPYFCIGLLLPDFVDMLEICQEGNSGHGFVGKVSCDRVAPSKLCSDSVSKNKLVYRGSTARNLPLQNCTCSCSVLLQTVDNGHFSPSTDRVVGETRGTIQQRPSSRLFSRRPLSAVLTWAGAGTSTL